MAARDALHEKFYEIVVRQNHRGLMAYALALTNGDRVHAEDVLQEALIVAYEKIAEFDQNRDFATWVRGIVRNKFLQSVAKRRESLNLEEGMLSIHELLDERFADIEDQAGGSKALLATLRDCIDKLGEVPKRTIELFYFENKKLDAIADDIGSSHAATQKRLERARMALHRCIRTSFTQTPPFNFDPPGAQA